MEREQEVCSPRPKLLVVGPAANRSVQNTRSHFGAKGLVLHYRDYIIDGRDSLDLEACHVIPNNFFCGQTVFSLGLFFVGGLMPSSGPSLDYHRLATPSNRKHEFLALFPPKLFG